MEDKTSFWSIVSEIGIEAMSPAESSEIRKEVTENMERILDTGGETVAWIGPGKSDLAAETASIYEGLQLELVEPSEVCRSYQKEKARGKESLRVSEALTLREYTRLLEEDSRLIDGAVAINSLQEIPHLTHELRRLTERFRDGARLIATYPSENSLRFNREKEVGDLSEEDVPELTLKADYDAIRELGVRHPSASEPSELEHTLDQYYLRGEYEEKAFAGTVALDQKRSEVPELDSDITMADLVDVNYDTEPYGGGREVKLRVELADESRWRAEGTESH